MKNLALILALLPISLASSARASDPALAAAQFAEGRAAVDRGDLDEGCAKLTLSLANDRRVGTLGKLAECEERRRHPATAETRWREAVTLARETNDARRNAAERELARLERTVPKLLVRVVTKAPNERVRLDAHPIDDAAPPLPLDPGEHVVEASADGFASWSSRVRLAADGSVTAIDVPALLPTATTAAAKSPAPAPIVTMEAPSSPSPDPSSDSAASAEPHSASPLRTVGIATTAVGAAALGVGAYFTARAIALNAQSNTAGGCVGDACDAAAASTRRDAITSGNTATVFLAGGGAVAVTALALFLFSPRGSPSPTGIQVTPTAGAKSAGLSLGGLF